jgi:hypothetical protein
MILEEIIGEAVFCVTRNGKCVELSVGDSFTEEEFATKTVTGKAGKAVIRVDQNCTVEIKATPVAEIVEVETKVVAKPVAKAEVAPKVETTTVSKTEETPAE